MAPVSNFLRSVQMLLIICRGTRGKNHLDPLVVITHKKIDDPYNITTPIPISNNKHGITVRTNIRCFQQKMRCNRRILFCLITLTECSKIAEIAGIVGIASMVFVKIQTILIDPDPQRNR